MKAVELNGTWQMKRLGEDRVFDAEIPGSVAAALLKNHQIEDPYFGDNELKVLPVFENDYVFTREFNIEESALESDMVLLHCDGLDTIGNIAINGEYVARVNNMHRTYVFDIKRYLKAGKNSISILFYSPVNYLKDHPSMTGKPFASIRKASCMFGWDWGLNLPDSGIWRDIYIETFDFGKIDHVIVNQKHRDGRVELEIEISCEVWGSEALEVETSIAAPSTEVIFCEIEKISGDRICFRASIAEPELWWPVGYGSQPLYQIECVLKKDGHILDKNCIKIGLRTIRLNREADGEGSKYEFIVNGNPVFFKGSNLIIEDAIISNSTKERWERLVSNCLKSNINGIRVWGGAYFPPDCFYELCDMHGIMIYQDFMFACTFYAVNEDFIENVMEEIEDNLKRINHHPSIALLNGNNEIDSIFTVMSSEEEETVALRKLFGQEKGFDPVTKQVVKSMCERLFVKEFPKACTKYAPDTSYVHSSPSVREPFGAVSFFDYLSDGDMHYYLQYNGNAPYQKMRTMRCRFMTEMGFQSYPSIKTIKAIMMKEDINPYSKVMYSHQKCFKGNETIETYMKRDYVVPSVFEDYVYLSQLQAGEIMKYSIEHMRRDSEYCRGMIIWQLNDCWPVVSWSGIDYYGRWKAQQYYTKRFYQSVLLSSLEEGTKVDLWITNDSMEEVKGQVIWRLRGNKNEVFCEGKSDVTSKAGCTKKFIALDFSDKITDENKNKSYLEYSLVMDGTIAGFGTVLFVLPKDFEFQKPDIKIQVQRVDDNSQKDVNGKAEEAYEISVVSDCFVKGVALDTFDGDCIFSDNFFDLSAGMVKFVRVYKKDCTGIRDENDLMEKLCVNHLNHVILENLEV